MYRFGPLGYCSVYLYSRAKQEPRGLKLRNVMIVVLACIAEALKRLLWTGCWYCFRNHVASSRIASGFFPITSRTSLGLGLTRVSSRWTC